MEREVAEYLRKEMGRPKRMLAKHMLSKQHFSLTIFRSVFIYHALLSPANEELSSGLSYELLKSTAIASNTPIFSYSATVAMPYLPMILPYGRDYIALVNSCSVYEDETRGIKKFSYTIPNPWAGYKIILRSRDMLDVPCMVRFRVHSSKEINNRNARYELYHFGKIVSSADMNYVERYYREHFPIFLGLVIPRDEKIEQRSRRYEMNAESKIEQIKDGEPVYRKVRITNFYPESYMSVFYSQVRIGYLVDTVFTPKKNANVGIVASMMKYGSRVAYHTFPLRDAGEQEVIQGVAGSRDSEELCEIIAK